MRVGWLLPKDQRSRPSAMVVLDSVSPDGHRLTTMAVVMHRFVLAEFNTHRAFSRNSASSRAIPVRKLLRRVLSDPAVPLRWAAERPGMQGGEELGWLQAWACRRLWLSLRLLAVASVWLLTKLHLHKSVANRLLEPWLWHTVLVSSTEWQNFFDLRVSPLAQPEIREAAFQMLEAYACSNPRLVRWGEWHLPYITDEDRRAVEAETGSYLRNRGLRMWSAARCARVSTLQHDRPVVDRLADEVLCGRLSSARPMHASPFEHVATPCPPPLRGEPSPHRGNFTGWDQWRHMLEAEVSSGALTSG